MTSEIRANTLKNRVGLGTVSYTNTGIVVSGIVTANSFSGTGDLDVDGHTNLDNLSIAGVVTTTGNVNVGVDLDVTDDITLGGELNMQGSSDNNKYIDARIGSSNKLIFRSSSGGAGNLVTMLQLGVSGTSLVGNFALGDSSDSSSAAGPEFTLNRNSSSPANADYLGQIKFAGRSSAGVQRNYAKITGKILDVTNGSEDGILEFSHIRNGSQAITGRWRSDSLQLLNDTNLSVAGDTTLTSDLDVDGHTNLDNVSIAGVTTFSNNVKFDGNTAGRDVTFIRSSNTLEFANNAILELGNGGSGDCRLFNNGTDTRIINGTGTLQFESDTYEFKDKDNTTTKLSIDSNGRLSFAGDTDTYIWHPSANQLAITRGGGSFPIVRIGTGGNGGTIGINTDSNLVTSGEIISVRGYSTFKSVNNLYAALYTHNEFQGSGNICAHILLNVGGANRGGFGYDTDNSTLIMGNHNAISFRTGVTNLNGTERMLIKNTGGVGINTSLIRNDRFLNIAAPSQDYSNSSTQLSDGGGIMLQHTDTLASTNRTYPGIFWSGNTASLGRVRAGILGVTAANNDATDIAFLTRYAANGTAFYPSDERVRITSNGYVHLGNTAHGTTKVGGQAITGQDFSAILKLYSSNSNVWLAQLRGDNTTNNGIFLRCGYSSSNYTLYATGYDENNPHLIVRGDGAVLIGESTQAGMQRGDVVVHASVQSGNVNEPAVIHRNSTGAIIYFEHYFYCNKGGSGNSHVVNQDIIQIQNIGNFHQAVFHCWMGVRLQGQGDNYTRPATWQTGVNRFNGGSTIQKEENWISADSQVQTYANLHVGNANSTSYYVRMNWASGTYGSSFAGGKIMGTFLGCDVANSNITFAYGRT